MSLNVLQFPFHHFVVLDTVTLSAFFLRETVLARAVRRAGLSFDVEQAHSALYDVDRTAELFCHMVNRDAQKRYRSRDAKNLDAE